MKVLFSFAAAVLAVVALPGAQAASGASCAVTHRDCYPACVKMAPDGSDCEKTRNVCKDICGPAPAYPAITNTERADMDRFEVSHPRSHEALAPDELSPRSRLRTPGDSPSP